MAELDKGCGASLIAPDMLLCAAHCEELARNSEFAYIGSHLAQQGLSRRIVSVIPHPNYDEFSGTYDFMILTLDRPIHDIEPVRLNGDTGIPGMIELRKQTTRGRAIARRDGTATMRQKNDNNDKNSVGELLTVLGFGVTNEGEDTLSETLQEVHVAYVPRHTCQDWYSGEIVDETTMFCAGFERGGKGTL
jgi:hypothetical protein